MKPIIHLLTIASLVLGTGRCVVADADGRLEAPRTDAAAGSTAVEKRILVTFVDERNGRVPIGDAGQGYRRRGAYGNSTWSEQLASRVAAKYRLKQLAQWPISALGVHCVVYEVPGGRSVEALLHDLAAEELVDSAQPMHAFHSMNGAALR